MKTRWLLWSFAFLGAFASGGCTENDGPTGPNGDLSLNGVWTGTITHYGSVGCAREAISLTLAQEGTTVAATFPTACQGMLELRGAVSGDAVAGELYRSVDGLRIGQVSGTASRTRIQVTTWRPQLRKERDEPPAREVINVIELAR